MTWNHFFANKACLCGLIEVCFPFSCMKFHRYKQFHCICKHVSHCQITANLEFSEYVRDVCSSSMLHSSIVISPVMKLLYSFHDFAGVVELVADYTVCTEGQNISPEASRILVLLSSLPCLPRTHWTCTCVVVYHNFSELHHNFL